MGQYEIKSIGICECDMVIGFRAFSEVNPGDILIFLARKGELKCPECGIDLLPINFGYDDLGKRVKIFNPKEGWLFPIKKNF